MSASAPLLPESYQQEFRVPAPQGIVAHMKLFSLQSFSAGVAIGILVATVWYLGEKTSFLLPAPPQMAQADQPAATVDSGAVAVSNQPAGNSVAIDSLTVPAPGAWVAVREVNGTDLGNVLGAVRIGGPRSNFSIPLLRATEPGQRYAVVLYRDDGSGVFDPGLSVYVDFETGERVVAYFTAR